MSTRPPAPVRVLVLLGAVAALLLAVCARQPKTTAPPAAAEPQAPSPAQAAPEVDAGQAAPAPEPTYFPATKAPPGLF
jgi:type IV pilus biogenesis protein CpaD/CtpE